MGSQMEEADARRGILLKIYDAYEAFSQDWKTACEKYCSDCCTRNVTMTTLEGDLILNHLVSHHSMDLVDRVEEAIHQPRYQPAVSINRMATLCADGDPLPEEPDTPVQRRCPFLSKDTCLIYPVRPFGCRCFISKRRCSQIGFADIDPFYITVHTVVQQIVEHVDVAGGTGNLSDVILFLANGDCRKRYHSSGLVKPPDTICTNEPLKTLMVPPEHRAQIEPLIKSLQMIR